MPLSARPVDSRRVPQPRATAYTEREPARQRPAPVSGDSISGSAQSVQNGPAPGWCEWITNQLRALWDAICSCFSARTQSVSATDPFTFSQRLAQGNAQIDKSLSTRPRKNPDTGVIVFTMEYGGDKEVIFRKVTDGQCTLNEFAKQGLSRLLSRHQEPGADHFEGKLSIAMSWFVYNSVPTNVFNSACEDTFRPLVDGESISGTDGWISNTIALRVCVNMLKILFANQDRLKEVTQLMIRP